MDALAPAYQDDDVTVYAGDCLDVLRELPDALVDAVVTDPPYNYGFMGREWDSISTFRSNDGYDRLDQPVFREAAAGSGRVFQEWCEQWARECLRILKPGGHLLAFGGTRTYHRLTCAIEDAGFEIRDEVTWVYASGFPKSLNIERAAGDAACQCGRANDGDVRGVRDGVLPSAEPSSEGEGSDVLAAVQRPRAGTGVAAPRAQGDGRADSAGARSLAGSDDGPTESGVAGWSDAQAGEGQLLGRPLRPLPAGPPDDGEGGRLRDGAPARDGSVDRSAADQDGGRESHRPRPVEQRADEPRPLADERGPQEGRGRPLCERCGKPRLNGWGTALKPAHEPIVVARKQIRGTVAVNMAEHGTGALNVDGCRVAWGADGDASAARKAQGYTDAAKRALGTAVAAESATGFSGEVVGTDSSAGRWPANVLLSHGPDCVARGTQRVATTTHYPATRPGGGLGNDGHVGQDGLPERLPGSEVVEAWDCAPGCPVRELDAQSGVRVSGAPPTRRGVDGVRGTFNPFAGQDAVEQQRGASAGGASRFFPTFRYEAKATPLERPTADGVMHPTVKPVALMQWLVRLVVPRGATVLDPFLGSGTTAEACVIEGMRCVGIEREPTYLPLIRARLRKSITPTLGLDL